MMQWLTSRLLQLLVGLQLVASITCLHRTFLSSNLRPVTHRSNTVVQRSSLRIRMMNAASQQQLQQQYAFLGDNSQSVYMSNILRRASDGTKRCLDAGCKRIEIAFPENRKSDISVSESLNTNRAFSLEFAKSLSQYGKNLWLMFPDNKELQLAADLWGRSNSFTLTSLDGAARTLATSSSGSSSRTNRDRESSSSSAPEVVIAINPGFNVEEWILLSELNVGDAAVVVINGNLDRLRNGYYPRIFYPKLGRVTDSYYRRFEQAFSIAPVAVGGDRQGAWLCKQFSSNWQLLVKQRPSSSSGSNSISSSRYTLQEQYESEPPPRQLWSTAKSCYQKEFGTFF